MLCAQSPTFPRRVHVDGEHHAGDAAAQTTQKTLHGGADVADIVEQQHDRLPIGGPPQAFPRRSPRYATGCDS
jgi:hypothetical protein